MRTKILCLLSLIWIVAAFARAQDSSASIDVKKLVGDELSAVASAPVAELWQRASTLVDLAPPADLAREVGARLAAGEGGDTGRLFLAALALAGSDPEVEVLASTLSPLLDSPRADVALAAASLTGDAHFKELGADERVQFVSRLSTVAEDTKRAPELRLEAACGWYVHGSGDDRRRARALMNDFLAASDPELRALGALALARSNAEVTGTLYDELIRLSAIPDARGRVAEAYLEAERVRERTERMLKLRGKVEDAPTDDKAGTGDESEQFVSVLRMIEAWHLDGDKVKRQELLNASLDGMLRFMDEHSAYFDGTEYARFEQDLEASYGGIGAYVGDDPEDGLFTITHPIYSGPAYRAGLISDDKIVRIGDWPTLGKPTDEVIKRLKGKPGSKVKLYVWRRGMDPALRDRPSEEMAYEITREAITIPAVQSQLLPGNIGMVVLHDFSRVASSELRQPILDLIDQGATSFVVDLRNNTGGLLDEAVNVAGLFLPKGSVVVSTDSRVNPREVYKTTADPLVPPEMPVAVLINRFTASAAEIVSGALQDHDRALLVGKRTFGKGSVQNLIQVRGMADDKFDDENRNGRHDNWEPLTKDFNRNGEFDYAPRIKLTIARYLLPSGRSIHRELDKEGTILNDGGVKPDLEVDLRSIEAWRIQEMLKVRSSNLIRDWVDAHFKQGPESFARELFERLADNDQRDPSQYPGFDELVAKLNTPLPADDVRAMLRAEIRRRVQDMRGKEFPQGDFVEDEQLQEAIRALLDKHAKKPADFAEYRAAISGQSVARVNLHGQDKLTVAEALAQLDKAKTSDGKLAPETLEKLSELLKDRFAQD